MKISNIVYQKIFVLKKLENSPVGLVIGSLAYKFCYYHIERILTSVSKQGTIRH